MKQSYGCCWREMTLTPIRKAAWAIVAPLSLAAKRGHEAVVRLLLARDDLDINSKSRTGDTAVYLAAKRGYEAVVRLLLARDDLQVSINLKNSVDDDTSGTTTFSC